MAEHPLFGRKVSTVKPRDYSARDDTAAVLKGEKKVPSDVDYRPAPFGSSKQCHECKFYTKFGESESDCKRVVGVVRAEGLCDIWEKRTEEPSGEGPKTTVVIDVR